MRFLITCGDPVTLMTLKNGHPGQFRAPIVRNGHFTTGQLGGFLGMFFQKFLFWALYGIPEILRRRKPACLELFGERIRR